MAKTPSTPSPQQGDTQPASQQQGQSPTSTPQQGQKPIIRDWAAF